MPIYNFRCNQCREEFELLVNVSSENSKRVCPNCKSNNVKRILSTFSVGRSVGRSSCESCVSGNCAHCS